MNKKALAVGLLVVSATVLAGCAATTPLEAGTQMCEDSLASEIRQAIPEPEAGWGDVKVTPKVTGHESRDGSEYVYDIAGTANVQISDGSTFTIDWECFTQTTNGKTYADVTVTSS